METQELKDIMDEVHGQFSELDWPEVGFEPVLFGRRNPTIANNRVMVVGRIGDELYDYAVVTPQYKMVRHEECIHQLSHTLLKEVPEYGKPQWKVKLEDNGGQMFATIDFPESKGLAVSSKKDTVHPRIVLKNSYDTSLMFHIAWAAWQKICSNGMMGWKEQSRIAKKHRLNLDRQEAIASIQAGMIALSEKTEQWKKWAQKQLDSSQFGEIWEALPFGKVVPELEKTARVTQRDEILALPITGSGLSLNSYVKNGQVPAWELHNATTQYLTHNVESEMVRANKSEEVEATFEKFMPKFMN